MSEPPPEFPSRTTHSTPACSRNQRTPAPMSMSACSSMKNVSLPRYRVFQPKKPPARQILTQVVLAEIHVVVGGDAGGLRTLALRRVVQALARQVASTVPARRGRDTRDELPIGRLHGEILPVGRGVGLGLEPQAIGEGPWLSVSGCLLRRSIRFSTTKRLESYDEASRKRVVVYRGGIHILSRTVGPRTRRSFTS